MVFRYARHTQNLEKLIGFYTKVLDFKVLGDFKDHNGYDGVFLGKHNENWHLEFTQDNNIPESQFDEDDILFSIQRLWKNFRTLLQIWNIIKFPSLNQKILTGKKTASASKIVTITKSLFLILESKIKTDVKRNFNLIF
jgi:hypothetical protein